MKWQDVRNQFPDCWLLVEALKAHTEQGQRIVEDMSVIEVYHSDFWAAWRRYKDLHHLDRKREYYVLHTERTDLDIGILDAFGFRPVG